MRLAALLLAALVLASGCLESSEDEPEDDAVTPDLDADGVPDREDDSDADGTVDAEDPTPLAVPEPLVFTGSLKGVGYQGLLPVAPPADPVPACTVQQCAEHVVPVPAGDWMVTFTLVGAGGDASSNDPVGVVSTDYDLFVDGVGESTNPSGEPDTVAARLAAGDYSAQVLGWQDVDGEYTLTVTFAA